MKVMDASRACRELNGLKNCREDGSVVVRVYPLDPKQQSKRSDGSLSTDGYVACRNQIIKCKYRIW